MTETVTPSASANAIGPGRPDRAGWLSWAVVTIGTAGRKRLFRSRTDYPAPGLLCVRAARRERSAKNALDFNVCNGRQMAT